MYVNLAVKLPHNAKNVTLLLPVRHAYLSTFSKKGHASYAKMLFLTVSPVRTRSPAISVAMDTISSLIPLLVLAAAHLFRIADNAVLAILPPASAAKYAIQSITTTDLHAFHA